MPSSARSTDGVALDAAERLTGERVTGCEPLPRSGNNRIYRVQTPQAVYALKAYAGGADGAQRLSREYAALLLLNPRGTARDVPRAHNVDRAGGFALYDWIDGTSVTAYDERDIDAATAFLQRAHVLRTDPAARELPDAAEAATSGAAVFEGLARRIERLRAATVADLEATAFIEGQLAPHLGRLAQACQETARASGWGFDRVPPDAARTLSPSDFSFHNALRRADGDLVFLDFEYFGWDDPVKLTADFLWHPAMRLSRAQAARFYRRAVELYGASDAHFEARLRCYFPVFGLKWCLIILNEFLAEDWNRRRFSGQGRAHADVKAAQLAKARRLFADVAARTRGGSG